MFLQSVRTHKPLRQLLQHLRTLLGAASSTTRPSFASTQPVFQPVYQEKMTTEEQKYSQNKLCSALISCTIDFNKVASKKEAQRTLCAFTKSCATSIARTSITRLPPYPERQRVLIKWKVGLVTQSFKFCQASYKFREAKVMLQTWVCSHVSFMYLKNYRLDSNLENELLGFF